MKLDEVPQDGAYLIEGKIRDVCYVVDKDGHYTRALSKGWIPKNEALKMAWEEIYNHAEETRLQVLEGKLSPIAFYMELNMMDIAILANYMEIPKRKVRKHLHMKGFNRLTPELLSRYADVLNIKPEELVDAERMKDIIFKHED
jgi:Trm5-related predicted tRNA methylase